MAESFDDFIAGWVSGAVGVIVTQPLDYMTTRLQSSASCKAIRGSFGLGTLWRGIGPLLSSVPFNNALLFYGYGVGLRVSETNEMGGESNLAPIFIGGCAGGAAQSFLQSPVELLKVRLQLAKSDVVVSTGITQQLGIAPPFWFRGLGATLLRDVIPHGIWFATYEWAKQSFHRRSSSQPASSCEPEITRSLTLSEQLAASATAATVAWGIGYPPDVIKTRIQMEGGVETIGQAVRSIYAEGGVQAFYRGFALKLCRAIPMSAIGFLVYEETMCMLRRLHAK